MGVGKNRGETMSRYLWTSTRGYRALMQYFFPGRLGLQTVLTAVLEGRCLDDGGRCAKLSVCCSQWAGGARVGRCL